MPTDRIDVERLDRLIDMIRERPFSAGPPEEVQRRVHALGQGVAALAPASRSSYRAFLPVWLRTAAVAAALLLTMDVGWLLFVNARRPVCWIRVPTTNTWFVMYASTRVQISQAP